MSSEPPKIRWSMESTCKLIELYRQNSVLWDPNNREYKNRYKRAVVLKEISTALNITSIDEVEKRIRNLNSQYTRERRNYKAMKKVGKPFHAKWFGYSLLGFLRDRSKTGKTLQREIQETDSSMEDSEYDEIETRANDSEYNKTELPGDIEFDQAEIQDASHIVKTEEFLNGDAQPNKEFNENIKTSRPKQKHVLTSTEDRNEEVNAIAKSIQQKRLERAQVEPDKFDIIGELVARKLRGLRTSYAQCTVEHLIHNLLYEAELGLYDEHHRNQESDMQ